MVSYKGHWGSIEEIVVYPASGDKKYIAKRMIFAVFNS